MANVAEYPALPNVIACRGSWIVKAELVGSSNFDRIESLTRDAAAVV